MEIGSIGRGAWRLAGRVDRAAAEDFTARCATLAAAADRIELELDDLEVADGAACGELVRAVRLLLARGLAVRLLHAPQALAHVIYRVGMMGQLELVEPREEEPTSS